jgi:hypothetical protein
VELDHALSIHRDASVILAKIRGGGSITRGEVCQMAAPAAGMTVSAE